MKEGGMSVLMTAGGVDMVSVLLVGGCGRGRRW